MYKIVCFYIFSIIITASAVITGEAQPSIPSAYNLMSGDYALDEWAASNLSGTYPANMCFHKTSTQDPVLGTEMTSDYTGAYNLTSGTRINGLGELGFSFINTGTNGYLGAAVLAVNSVGRTNIQVSWTGRTITPNVRIYGICLQYKVGTSGSFADLLSEYVRSETAGDFVNLPAVTLPAETENQTLVQLRWKYYYISGTSGARAELAVDNISVTSELSSTALLPPALLSPSDLSVEQPVSNLMFNWQAAENANSYDLQVSAFSDFSIIFADVTNITGINTSLSGFSTAMRYYWHVRSENASQTSAWTDAWSFLTEGAVPLAPELSFPTNSYIGASSDLTFEWIAAAGASSYRLQVARVSTFDEQIVADVENITDLSYTVEDLPFDVVLYWHVLGVNSNGSGPWSEIWNFQTTTPPIVFPEPFVLANGNYSFTAWSSLENAGTYPPNMIFHRGGQGVQDPVLETPMVTNYLLEYNRTSQTRINGLGELGASFINTSTNGNLGAAVLALNTEGRDNIRIFWTGRTITPNERVYRLALQYRLGSSGDFINLNSEYERNDVVGHFQDFGPIALPYEAENQPLVQLRWKYYFVSGNNNARAELALDEVSVQSDDMSSTFPVPELASPENGSVNVSPDAELVWHPTTDGMWYNIQVSNQAGFQNLIYDMENNTDTTYLALELPFSTQIYWRVQAANPDEISEWSESWSFTTEEPPILPPLLLLPANNAVNITVTPLLDWDDALNADSYNLEIASDASFANVVYYYNGIYGTEFEVPASALNYNTVYYWHVSSNMGIYTSSYSSAWSFTTMLPPPSNPELFDLSSGDYILDSWAASNPAGTYPPNMLFHRTAAQDPGYDAEMVTDYTGAYNLTSQSRINGKDDQGFSFINTSTNGNLGAAVLGLNTTGRENIRVTWTGRTITPNTRIYRIVLQYKTGSEGTYISTGYEYERNAVTGHFEVLGPIVLPEEVNNQPEVYLRWKYYYVSGSSSRAELAVDDILVQSDEIIQPASFDMELNAGWNMISSYIAPADADIRNLLSPIEQNMLIIKNGLGDMYIPSWDINLIGSWNVYDGYYIYMLNSDMVNFSGTMLLPEENPIDMPSGWNLISYLRNSPISIETALSGIVDNLIIAKDGDGNMYIPSYQINLIGNMLPGRGYHLYLTSSSVLTYPANGSGRIAAREEISLSPKYLRTEIAPTGRSSTLLIEFGSGCDGCEIGIYDECEILIGSACISNGKAAVNIWGDNLQTAYRDGAENGEMLYVKLLDTRNGSESLLDLTGIKDIVSGISSYLLKYEDNSIMVSRAVPETELREDTELGIYPNPIRDNAVIGFTMEETGSAALDLYDLQGSRIMNISSGFFPAGYNTIDAGLGSVPPGIYMLVCKTGNSIKRELAVILK